MRFWIGCVAVMAMACGGAPASPSAAAVAAPAVVHLRMQLLSHDVANAVVVNGTPYYQAFPDEPVTLVGDRYVPGEPATKRTNAQGVVEWDVYFGVPYRLRARGLDFGENVLGGRADWLIWVEAGRPF